ncbi:MAG: exosortase/archaeosortase family protein, partial [Planctomycetales bacterium]
TLVVFAGLLLALLYCFANSFSTLWLHNWNDPQYSFCYLVQNYAGIILWWRWDPTLFDSLESIPVSQRWWGAALLAFGIVMRVISAYLGVETAEMAAFIPCLAGVVLIAFGWPIFKWSAPAVVFLGFMFPLPWTIERRLLDPLKTIATSSSNFLLQMMGYGSFREGNVIHVAEVPMGVIDACSGLRMLTVFLALCGMVALTIKLPLWERIVIFLSAIPIALGVNVLRITITGMAFYHLGPEWYEWVKHVFHENAGYFMMPMAMLMLYLEIVILERMFSEAPPEPRPRAIRLEE